MVILPIFGKFRRSAEDTKSGNRLIRWLVLLQIMLSIQFPTGVWRDNELEEVILHSRFLLYRFIISQKIMLHQLISAEAILRYFYFVFV